MHCHLPKKSDGVIISVNPKAGRSSPMRRAEQLRDRLLERGLTVEISTDLDRVTTLANEWHAAGRLRTLVGVGGDGTAAVLVNRTAPGTPITLLRAGTANLLAKEFRLPGDPARMAAMIEVGAVVTLDAGRIRPLPYETDPQESERLFLVMVTAGIDAEIVRRVHQKREESYRTGAKRGGHIGYHSYIGPIFQAIFSYSYPNFQICFDESLSQKKGRKKEGNDFEVEPSRKISARWAFVFNIARYGFGGAPVVKCRADDDRLDLCGLRPGGFWPSIFAVALVQFGKLHRFLPGTFLGTARHFRLTPDRADARIPIEADGDPAGFLPVTIESIPSRWTMVVPDDVAKRYALNGEKTVCGVLPEAVLP